MAVHIESPLTSPEGESEIFSGSYVPKYDAEGRIDGLIGYFTNVTERKRREERIVKLTRLYAVLSQVNEAIVRSEDTKSLYLDVCRIVVETGGFPLAWVGQVVGERVVPLASWGPGADYVREIIVEVQGTWGAGPTGTCIRENRVVVNDDFAVSPATIPWRDAALRYGFRGSAAFPLRRQGKTVGSLTLYACEPKAFDAEQVGLLESLSADLSYALDAIDHEHVRIQSEEALRQAKEDWGANLRFRSGYDRHFGRPAPHFTRQRGHGQGLGCRAGAMRRQTVLSVRSWRGQSAARSVRTSAH